MATKTLTPFETAKQQVAEGKLQTPHVSANGKQVDYFGYQLATHHFNLKLMAKGLAFRGLRLKDLKSYYGLTGRSASDCLPQFEELLSEHKKAFTNQTTTA